MFIVCHLNMCRRCWSEQWRRHPADHYHYPRRWSHWDLQDDWQRGPGINFISYWVSPLFPTVPLIPSLTHIFNQRGFSLYIAWHWNGINSPPCMYPAIPELQPSPLHQTLGCLCATPFPNSLLYLYRMNIINTHQVIVLHFIVAYM